MYIPRDVMEQIYCAPPGESKAAYITVGPDTEPKGVIVCLNVQAMNLFIAGLTRGMQYLEQHPDPDNVHMLDDLRLMTADLTRPILPLVEGDS